MQNQLLKDVVSYKYKATYHNPIKRKKIKEITVKGNYMLIPMALRDFGKCFKLYVSKEVMPYKCS